ncbi:nucleotidyltransferase family protein [Achromobacter spanius]|uniref:nucleotidyltransferase family protein n=1 Tax=Achromobacter spanius TaxID=217203 RepID=UPI003209222E
MFDLATNPDNDPPTRCVGILLAAGRGRRYAEAAPGQDKLTALLADGTPVAVAAATALRAATTRVVAITRPGQASLQALLANAGCEVITTDPHAAGMGDSLAAAAQHLLRTCGTETQTCLVALGDMPWVRTDTCLQVARLAFAHPIVAPVWNGRRGHPVAFHRSLWPALAALAGDTGARVVLESHGATELAVSDSGICADIDTPADLQAGALLR